ncbi:MAG TPA: hypothetical protein VLG40_04305 [Candidatus Saccharimonas sp.]|nr:hypothetical protein [Candidatus Saccharimonas sp.]
MKPYDYQRMCLQTLAQDPGRQQLVMSVGLGRRTTGAFLIGQRMRSGRVLVVCHNKSALRGWKEALTTLFGLGVWRVKGDERPDTPITLLLSADPQSLNSVDNRAFRHIVVDESGLPKTLEYIPRLEQLLGSATLLGLTERRIMKKDYSSAITAFYGPPIVELTLARALALGYLRPLEYSATHVAGAQEIVRHVRTRLAQFRPSTTHIIFEDNEARDRHAKLVSLLGKRALTFIESSSYDRQVSSPDQLILVNTSSVAEKHLACALQPTTTAPLHVFCVTQSSASASLVTRFADQVQTAITEEKGDAWVNVNLGDSILQRGRGSRNFTKAQAASQLKNYVVRHGKTPSIKAFDADTLTVSSRSIMRVFETTSWNKILRKVGIEPIREYHYSTADILAIYFAEFNGVTPPRANSFKSSKDLPDPEAIKRVAGVRSWSDVHTAMLKLRDETM